MNLKYNDYFISPERTIIPIEEKHISTIVKHPRRFGLDRVRATLISAHNEYYKMIDSPLSARSRSVLKLIRTGWIAVRFSHGLHFEVKNLGKNTRERIYDFLKKVSRNEIQSSEYDPFVYIFTYNGRKKILMRGTIKDILARLHASRVRKLKLEILITYDLLCGNPMCLPDYALVGRFKIDGKEYELRVYQEFDKHNEFSFHLIPPDRTYEAVINANNMVIVEWKYEEYPKYGISKELIAKIKEFFHQPFEYRPEISEWEWFIQRWNCENDGNPYGLKANFSREIRPEWWNEGHSL